MTAAFQNLAALVNRAAGIVVEPHKRFVVESRLSPIARAHGLGDVDAMIRSLLAGGDQALLDEVIDALTTNETFFFRDAGLFDLLRRVVIPALKRARAGEKRLRIWCNACSTGQEPYSLAMILDDGAQDLAGWRIDLLATDISRRAIEAARAGLYNRFEVQRGLPASALLKYFEMDGERWRISDKLKSAVRFANFNLLRPYDDNGQFDLILCRNVLIYFDEHNRRDILTRLARSVRQDGYLILGSTETPGVEAGCWARAAEGPMLLVRSDGPRAPRELSPAP